MFREIQTIIDDQMSEYLRYKRVYTVDIQIQTGIVSYQTMSDGRNKGFITTSPLNLQISPIVENSE